MKEVQVIDSFSPSNFNIETKKQLGSQTYQRFYSDIMNLPDESAGIIFIKQKYESLFHKKSLIFPSISSIKIFIGNFDKKFLENNHKEDTPGIAFVKIQPTKISMSTNQPSETKSQLISDKRELEEIFLPTGQSDAESTLAARKILQKKIWVKVNGPLNNFEVHAGDLVDPQSFSQKSRHQRFHYQKLQLDKKIQPTNSWDHSQQTFSLQDNKVSNKVSEAGSGYDSQMFHLKNYYFEIQFRTQRSQEQIKSVFSQCHKYDVLKIKKIYNSIINKNPSILSRDANLFGSAPELQALYAYLEKLSLSNLPKPGQKGTYDQDQYDSWRGVNHAINYSLTKKYGYLGEQPIGILNHLVRMKRKNNNPKYDPKTDDEWMNFNYQGKTRQELLKTIIKDRDFYVRFEVTQAEGIAPGANAVLEIWPPFCCSPIHNHGEAFGLIKILSNQICVQNFNDLNFNSETNKPFNEYIYQKNQFTWLSEYSFGIHRLINTTNTVTLSLQSYGGTKGSKQFFQFIDKDQGTYSEYYPQHDWYNYLTYFEYHDKTKEPEDYKFIEDVKKFYNLKNVKKDGIDDTFAKFVMVMKQEYQCVQSSIKTLYDDDEVQDKMQKKE